MGGRGASGKSAKYRDEYARQTNIAIYERGEDLLDSIRRFSSKEPRNAFYQFNKEHEGAPLAALKAEAKRRGILSIKDKAAVNKELKAYQAMSDNGDLAGGKGPREWQRVLNKFTKADATVEQAAKVSDTLRKAYVKLTGRYPAAPAK